MDFEFNDDQELLRSSTRNFLDRRSSLGARRPGLESDEGLDRDIWREGATLGWTAMLVAQDFDGGSVSAQPLVDLVSIAEEFGRSAEPGPLLPTNVIAEAIARSGNHEQRRRFLPSIVAGETIAAWCMSGDGSPEPSAVGVTASPDGDGYILSGIAGYVHGATYADLFLVSATNGSTAVQVLVPASTRGVRVRPLVTLDLTRRFGDVSFDNVRVPVDDVVATAQDAASLQERALRTATVLQAAECVGAAEHLFATTLQYAKDRVQFGRAIGSFQAIKHRFADLAVSVEAMRAGAHYAALAVADDADDAALAVGSAGSYVKEAHTFLCGECLQLTGGIGFTWEHDLHLYLRRARTDEVLYGDPSWHRERLCQLLTANEFSKEFC